MPNCVEKTKIESLEEVDRRISQVLIYPELSYSRITIAWFLTALVPTKTIRFGISRFEGFPIVEIKIKSYICSEALFFIALHAGCAQCAQRWGEEENWHLHSAEYTHSTRLSQGCMHKNGAKTSNYPFK